MRRTRKKRAVKRGNDLISQLPDSILACILSFLSTKEAARTCLLSKRWTALWTHAPSIDFNFADFIPQNASDYKEVYYYFKKFKSIIKSVLNQRQDSLSAGFRLVWLYDTSYGFDPSFGWIPQVMDLKPSSLCLIAQTTHTSPILPGCLFNCQSLEKLELKIETEHESLFDSLSINLPRLKSLDLSFVSIHSHLMKNLLSGCAKLEELKLERCELTFSKLISGTLKSLVVCDCVINKKICFSIPSLLDLRVSVDYPKSRVSFKDMSSLEKAYICFDPVNAEESDVETRNKLFPGLSNVAILDFELRGSNCRDMMIMLQHALVECPTFNNLHSFTVTGPLIPIVHLITRFVKRMPNLGKFIINHDENSSSQEFRRHDLVECEHLPLVEIKYKRQHNHVSKLVEALRAHVKSIGEIHMEVLKD
ncbi:hypothetical protein LUZ63_004145 [Rhynchospora breviuscula]|uniref:F-box domain-containing protein n=1 Tax=Rhynchospora breviuscula TaxID=2022672 RepID=A0A9Q0HZN3_9POAL|nr:hypothetical protein LUZ63_004145 [Rhynchospora breviuscula]